MKKGYELIGSKEKAVAILEIREEEKDKELSIAKKLLEENKFIASVIRKDSKRIGEFRNRKYTLLAGSENTEVIHKEHGFVLKLDPQKTYFSSREGTERQRIAKQVKPNEIVMVMFAGIGPYAVAIGKKQPNVKKIISIEINPNAVDFMKYNIRANKLSHKIIPILGDVKKVSDEWFGKCDRIVMPLPLHSADFLEIAAKCAKKGGVIHFYSWGNKADGSIFAAPRKIIDEKLKNLNVKYKIIGERKVLPYAPGRYKVCIEIMVD